jgi:hypothetical protein
MTEILRWVGYQILTLLTTLSEPQFFVPIVGIVIWWQLKKRKKRRIEESVRQKNVEESKQGPA